MKLNTSSNTWQLNFSSIPGSQTTSIEITLTNPTSHYVNWKVFSESPAQIKLIGPDDSIDSTIDSSLSSASSKWANSVHEVNPSTLKSAYSVFSVTPQVGDTFRNSIV